MTYIIAFLAAASFIACLYSIFEDQGSSSKMLASLTLVWTVALVGIFSYDLGEEKMKNDFVEALITVLPTHLQEQVFEVVSYNRSRD